MPKAVLRCAILCALLAIVLSSGLAAQFPTPSQPPARPRILFTAAQVPALAAKVQNPGTQSGWAWGQMVPSATFQCGTSGGSCPGGTQSNFRLMRSMRWMTELAARYAILGDTAAGANARSFLISGTYNAINQSGPGGMSGGASYQHATYPMAIGFTYDMIRPLLTTSERAAVVAELESWIPALQGVIASHGLSSATQNFGYSSAAGIAVALMAIWGDSNRANIPQDIATYLTFLREGYLDSISPDGTIDESYGYANYGELYSLYAMIAGLNCGFGDRIANTNILRTPKWYACSLLGNSFPWIGDCSPLSKGMNVDPILYYVIRRENDAAGLWGLQRIQQYSPIDHNLTTWCLSPYLATALHYPEGLNPAPPAIYSAFFRDNLNLANGSLWNAKNNHPAVGTGGTAFLHNSANANEAQFALYYIIRDEWMNHNHEDDGHVGMVAGGRHQIIDRGPFGSGYTHAQHSDHNIVTVVGGGQFHVANHYNPPSTDGRFRGTKKSVLITPSIDYVHGDHKEMWMMDVAERSVVLVKDPNAPYSVVFDEVRAGSGSSTYEQRWNTSAPMGGSGTFANPYTINSGGSVLRSFYLAPSQFSLAAGPSGSNASIPYVQNRILTTASGVVNYLSVHHSGGVTSSNPLVSPSANVKGGRIGLSGGRTDKIMFATNTSAISDHQTTTNGQFAWIRTNSSGALLGYAVGEGTQFSHAGTTLVTASAPVSVSVGNGAVHVARAPNATGSVSLTVHAIGTITQVVIDGAPVSFSTQGGSVLVGSATQPPPPPPPPPPPLPPPPVTNDRFYAFTGGDLLDAVGTPTVVTTSDGRITSGNGLAYLLPRGAQHWPNGNLWIAVEAQPVGGSMEQIGAIQFGSSPGGQDLLSVDLYGSNQSNGLFALPYHLVSSSSIANLPAIANEASIRIGVLYEPVSGRVTIHDRLGAVREMTFVPGFSGNIHLALVMTPSAIFDNFCVFDSAEDGVVPQGVAVWLTGDHRLGWAIAAPNFYWGWNYGMTVGGIPMPMSLITSWLSVSQFADRLFSHVYSAGMPLPPSIREFATESEIPSVPGFPSIAYTINYTSALGTQLTGGAWYTP